MRSLWAYFGMFVLVFGPMIALAGLLLWLGLPDAFAGLGAVLGWGFFLAYLADQERKRTRIGVASRKVARFLGSEYI